MAIKVHDHTFIFHDQGGNEVVFEVSNEDNTASDYQYYGYLAASGAWIIQRFYVVGSTIQYRYAAGKTRTDYDDHWNADTGRWIEGTATWTTFDEIKDNLN